MGRAEVAAAALYGSGVRGLGLEGQGLGQGSGQDQELNQGQGQWGQVMG